MDWVHRFFGPELGAAPLEKRSVGWRGVFLFMALGILPGIGALDAPLMLAFDDRWATTQNPLIAQGWGHLWDQVLMPFGSQAEKGYAQTGHWAPVSFLSLALDHAIFGKGVSPGGPVAGDFSPWGFRLMTGLYHGLCGFLVFSLARRLLGKLSWSLLAGLLFLFHPVVCESVCWIVERHNVLAALFGLLALNIYTDTAPGQQPSWRRTLAATGALLLSQLSKPSGISWWPVMVAWDIWLRRPADKPKQARGQLFCRWLLLFLPLALTVYVYAISKFFIVAMMEPLGLGRYGWFGPWLMCAYLLLRYVLLLLWPLNPSFFYHVSPGGPDWAIFLAGAAAVAGILVWSRRSGLPWPRLALYAVWMAAGVAPVVNPFVTSPFPFQDRYTYPSLPALACLAADLFMHSWPRQWALRPVLPAAALVALLASLSMADSTRWRTVDSLLVDAIRKQPASAFGHYYYGNSVLNAAPGIKDGAKRKELLELARVAYQQALASDDFERLIAPLLYREEYGTVLFLLGDEAGARQVFLGVWEGRAERPTEAGAKLQALYFLARNAIERNQLEQGLAWSDAGLRLSPWDPTLLRDRLEIWVRQGQHEKAHAEARRLLKLPALKDYAASVLQSEK